MAKKARKKQVTKKKTKKKKVQKKRARPPAHRKPKSRKSRKKPIRSEPPMLATTMTGASEIPKRPGFASSVTPDEVTVETSMAAPAAPTLPKKE